LDGVELYGYVASGIGLNDQHFSIGLRDRTSQPIAVLQDYLVGECRDCQ
jgi:hypothetical protein